MSSFNDFDSVYKHLESDALNYRYNHQIASLFQKLRDKKVKENKKEEVKRAQWEIDFFRFVLEGNDCKCTWSGTKDSGEVFEYPTFSNFDENTYRYLKNRLENTNNSILKARYSHVLWASPKKHSKYAKIAIDAYLELVEIFILKDKENPKDYYGSDVINSIKCAYYISTKIKYKIDQVKSKILELIHNYDPNSSFSHVVKNDLINLMLKHYKRFDKTDFNRIDDICWELSEKLYLQDNLHLAIEIAELGERVERKLNSDKYEWRTKIAEIFEELTSRSAADLTAIHFCKAAIQNYKLIKNKTKVQELEKKFAEFKESLELSEFKTNVNIEDHVKACKKAARNILKENPDDIIKILMLNKDLLPRKIELEESVKKNAKHAPLQHIIPITIHDQAGNPIQHFSTDDNKFYYHILQQYDFDLRIDKIYLINEIIFTCVLKDKLNSQNLFEFFKKYSWFGKDLKRKVFSKENVYNWLNLLMPSINDYFFQLKLFINNRDYYPNCVLAIDSLTLKIEGLLRDFCRLSGITTFTITQDKQNRTIAKEKDIHNLLHEEPVKKLFDDDDLLFFKFLLIEKAGYNLRHKVAHSLMFFDNYSLEFMNLLLLCLLKIGKYDLIKKVGKRA